MEIEKIKSLSIDNREGQSLTIMVNGEWINPKDITSMDIHIEPGMIKIETKRKTYYSI
jgi:hypothetical protein